MTFNVVGSRPADFYGGHPEIDLQVRLYAQDLLISGQGTNAAFITAESIRILPS
jgi:hypothetical protein